MLFEKYFHLRENMKIVKMVHKLEDEKTGDRRMKMNEEIADLMMRIMEHGNAEELIKQILTTTELISAMQIPSSPTLPADLHSCFEVA